MTRVGTWVPYAGVDALLLSAALLAVAAVLAYLGTRLRGALAVTRPGRAVGGFLIVIWWLSIQTFLVAATVYVRRLQAMHLGARPLVNHITPITLLSAAATFGVLLYLTRRLGWRGAVRTAFFGAAAGPMVFELPFDLIVMTRTYPPVLPNPTLYRALFFLPLFIVEISTFSLLTLLPTMRVSKYTLYSLAAMILVFAVWALFGFSYPATPASYTLNSVSKVLSFATIITLFLNDGHSGDQTDGMSIGGGCEGRPGAEAASAVVR